MATANSLTNSEDCKKFWSAMEDFMNNREHIYHGFKISEYHLFKNHNYHRFGRLGRTPPSSICLAKQWWQSMRDTYHSEAITHT